MMLILVIYPSDFSEKFHDTSEPTENALVSHWALSAFEALAWGSNADHLVKTISPFSIFTRWYKIHKMPHFRSRHLTSLLNKTSNFSPLVGILGHRQVGKTTLATEVSERYLTFDDPAQLNMAQQDPKHFLQSHSGRGICTLDECQMVPELFPALKEWVRVHQKPGQFLLTGSVRFSSRKQIRESLTGRIITWELLPMDLSEAHDSKLPNTLPQLLASRSLDLPLKACSYFTHQTFDQALKKGGLPGIFSVRDASIRSQRFESMLSTLLERDLRLVLQTTLGLSSLRALIMNLALHQTRPIEWASLSRITRISVPTLKKVIQAFEALFLIRLIRTEGTEQKPVLFLEDQGEATYLAGDRYDAHTQLLRFLYANLRHQLHYRPELCGEIFQFRNRGGACVPLCFRVGKSVLGILPSLTENPPVESLATARSFLKTYSGSKLLYVHSFEGDRLIEPRIRSLGWRYLV